MTDTVVIAEERAQSTGYRFSWGLAIAGGVAATAVTFFLLSLGSGFGLLLINPVTHSGLSTPTFLTGGAIYFIAAQAFGFAVGGHIAGRLIGPVGESAIQEEFRAEAHGLLSWAVAVLATVTMVAITGLAAASTGASTAALYGLSPAKTVITPSAYLVDILFRPGPSAKAAAVVPATSSANADGQAPQNSLVQTETSPALPINSANAAAEAGRIVDAGLVRGQPPTPGDRSRLIDLISAQTGVSSAVAGSRVDGMQADLKAKSEKAANLARKIASYASMWIALSLLFGAIVSITAAIEARKEDDLDNVRTS